MRGNRDGKSELTYIEANALSMEILTAFKIFTASVLSSSKTDGFELPPQFMISYRERVLALIDYIYRSVKYPDVSSKVKVLVDGNGDIIVDGDGDIIGLGG